MLKVAVVGYGYWGPNLVRNLNECPGAQVVAICDRSSECLERARRRYPITNITTDYKSLLRNHDVDAVCIATPVDTHYELAVAAIRAGKHVLVEKPLTDSVEHARSLVDEAARTGVVLLVDHIFLYAPAIRKIHDLVRKNELGELFYYDSSRVNLGLFQRDVDVIWDLAVHDFAILSYLLDQAPKSLSATGVAHFAGHPVNIANVNIFYPGNFIAHVSVNWLAPVKLRRLLIGGSKKMIVMDDLDPSDKVRVYDKGVEVTDDPTRIQEMRVGYRVGDMLSPKIDSSEALSHLITHFCDCITQKVQPISGGKAGLKVVEMLTAATVSMRNHGAPVALEP